MEVEMQEFIERCERFEAAMREAGYDLTVKEIETVVLAGLAVECEMLGMHEQSEEVIAIARRNLAAS
jgi:hypothetical protein